MNGDAMQPELPVFVYGTLLPEQPNAHVWGGGIAALEPAVLERACLYDMGHYPMLVEEGAGRVTGALVTVRSQTYTAVLARLDDLEGFDPAQPEASAYRRLQRDVVLVDGRRVTAWVYVGGAPYVQDCERIEGGDWAAYVHERQADPGAWWSDVQTVRGLHEDGRGRGE